MKTECIFWQRSVVDMLNNCSDFTASRLSPERLVVLAHSRSIAEKKKIKLSMTMGV